MWPEALLALIILTALLTVLLLILSELRRH